MSKKLVAYFSATGTTSEVAVRLSEAAEGDLFEIKPEIPYSSADLDWHDPYSRSNMEMDDKCSRPAISSKVSNMEQYDAVFVGFPIWWYTAPRIIKTFLESYDFAGKKIVLFATSGGSGISDTKHDLEPSVDKTATWLLGKRFDDSVTGQELKDWVNTLDI